MTESSSLHLDLDALADALAGEGSGKAHLGSCSSCTSRLAELAAAEARVTAALGTLPVPTVPAAVVDRLTAAFAAEAPLTAQPSSTVTPLSSARPPRRRWLPAAAAAVLLVSAAGIGYAVLADPGGGDDAASTAATQPGPVLNASGTDYGDEAAVAAVLPAVLGGTAGAADRFSAGSAPEARSQQDSAAGSTSSQQSDSALTAQAPAPVAGARAADPLERLRTPDGLADCLSALVPPEEPDLQPLALDYAQYQGSPALAVVLPDPDPGKLAVYVVGPACTQGGEDLLRFLRVEAP